MGALCTAHSTPCAGGENEVCLCGKRGSAVGQLGLRQTTNSATKQTIRSSFMTRSDTTATSGSLGKTDLLILTGLSLALFSYHMLTSTLSSYGYFIDEFYYIACSKHLAFGYVDHPPVSVFLLALSRSLFGDSMPALRLFPALAASATVFMTGLIAHRLGGSLVAIVIAALAVIAMPVFQLMGSFYSMNAFEPLIWTSILYFIIRLVQEEKPQYWLVIGLLMGVGLETKHTMAVYAAALVVGMLLTGTRRLLWNRWFLWGALSCLFLLLPNLIWQYVNGFPSVEFYRNAMVNKNVPRGPLNVFLDQILFTNPFAFPLWITGLLFLFVGGSKYRFLGWAYLVLLSAMVLSQSSRPDRIGAMYTLLFAAGAVAIEKIRRPAALHLVRVLMLVLLVGGAIVAAPVTTPILPPTALKAYLSAIGFSFSVERGKMNEPIPQWLADRLGWRELAVDVAHAYHSLPAEEQRNTVLVSTNYGEAGALELYGAEFGLPRVYATHNSYHLWGPPPDSVKTYIAVFVGRRDLESRFETVVEAGLHTCEDCTQPQRKIPIYVARGPKFSIAKEWESFKIYN
jgi:4-amino-4-deoxy-L-arabinose transferase-like glycosyltransferase